MERSSFLFAVNALLTVMAEVMLDLLERAATRLRHELVDEGEAEKADGRKDEERSREAERVEQRREGRADAEVRQPEAEDGAAHAHTADAQREELREQQPGDRGKETLLEEQEGDGQRKDDERQDLGAGEQIRRSRRGRPSCRSGPS